MKRKSDKNGFTATELMIAVALFTIIVGLSMTSFMSLAMVSSVTSKHSEMYGSMRLAMDRMTKDVRMANHVLAAGSNYIKLEVPYTASTQTVWYIESSDQLYRIDDNTFAIIAYDTDAIDVDLYDEDGNETLVATNAYSVDITLTGDAKVLTSEIDGVVQSRVLLRNKGLQF